MHERVKGKTGNEDLEDLIESIPHHDQIMHSIQEMYPSGMVITY